MSHQIKLATRLPYPMKGDPWKGGSRQVLVHASAAGKATLEAVLDTGAVFTILKRAELERLGLTIPSNVAEGDPNVGTFSGGGASDLKGYRFEDVTLEIDGTGELVTLDVYGAMFDLRRNLIGQDFMRKAVICFNLLDDEILFRPRSQGSGVTAST